MNEQVDNFEIEECISGMMEGWWKVKHNRKMIAAFIVQSDAEKFKREKAFAARTANPQE